MVRKYIYWISTTVLCAVYPIATVFYMTQADTLSQADGALVYPAYLLTILTMVKLVGPAMILARVSVFLSDLAYVGMLYYVLLALSAHLVAAEYAGAVQSVVGLAALVASFVTQNAARKKKSPYSPEGAACFGAS
ncbi:DoxX family protein [Rhizobium ruizarguesonis]|uniref:DoxX family protein n=1 Tax=Rhizobium ruizarguesonis TaxID=2081791 RepID=UPI0013EE4EFC|nr:DoxX family protein [Rhizobium ruizarguesonis]